MNKTLACRPRGRAFSCSFDSFRVKFHGRCDFVFQVKIQWAFSLQTYPRRTFVLYSKKEATGSVAKDDLGS